jgi:hypothetical protein
MPGRKRKWNLADAEDLAMNRVYAGRADGQLGGEPIQRLLPVGNQGGFRRAVRRGAKLPYLVVLFTTTKVSEWPDVFDWVNGTFTYWGDNRRGTTELEKTHNGGNALLAKTFRFLEYGRRDAIPPFFVFEHAGKGRDVVFRGLAVPGVSGLPAGQDLVAEWREGKNGKFQNYRAMFTILNVEVTDKRWIADLISGVSQSVHVPLAWKQWVEAGEVDRWSRGTGT